MSVIIYSSRTLHMRGETFLIRYPHSCLHTERDQQHICLYSGACLILALRDRIQFSYTIPLWVYVQFSTGRIKIHPMQNCASMFNCLPSLVCVCSGAADLQESGFENMLLTWEKRTLQQRGRLSR